MAVFAHSEPQKNVDFFKVPNFVKSFAANLKKEREASLWVNEETKEMSPRVRSFSVMLTYASI